MRRTPPSQLRPSSIELWYIAFIACVLILVGNGKLLLERAGLITSADLIGQQVSTTVLWGNNWLDNFRFTAGVINLLIWGATGLVIYSALQALVRAVRVFEYERDFDSQLYVHPQGFTHTSYWRQIIIDAVIGFALLAVFVVVLIGYIAVILPDSFVYMQHFILSPGLHTMLDPFIGFDIAWVGTAVIYILLRVVIRHHRISAFDEE